MKRMNLFKIAILAFGLAFFASCGDDDNSTSKPLNVTEVKNLDAKDYTQWVYYSFEKGFETPVGKGEADPEKGDDAKWKERTDWDIAFHRYDIRTNSGTSGKGKGGVIKMEETDLASVTEAPETGYIVDVLGKVMLPKHQFVDGAVCATTKGWAKYIHGEGYNIKPFILVVKTANGKYAKIHVKNYLNEKDESGFISFDYVYQADGSTNLK